MKFVLMPDSFKGTLSSATICHTLRDVILKHAPSADVVSIPVADGGEGTVDAFLEAMGGEKITLSVTGPKGHATEGFYGILTGGEVAVVEMAAAAGLPLVSEQKNPLITTTYGVGELILDAARRGVKKIVVGLGGSATNDGGCGAAAAVGIRFLDAHGKCFVPTGQTLKDIASIDMSHRSPDIDGVEIVTMCDIDNPLYGPQGAAYVFAPQKGADDKMVALLDDGLRHLSAHMSAICQYDIQTLAGGGAAGGMGAGMHVFFSSTLQMGIDTVLDIVGFEKIAKGATYVITGEGRLDGQSLRGKVIMGIAKRAKSVGVPVLALVGGVVDKDITPAYDTGLTSVFPIHRLPQDFSVCKAYSQDNLRYTMDNIMRLLTK